MSELDLADELEDVSIGAAAFLVLSGAAAALASVSGLIVATAGVV